MLNIEHRSKTFIIQYSAFDVRYYQNLPQNFSTNHNFLYLACPLAYGA